MVVTVCSMKKSEKFSGYPLFKISGKNFGFGGVISFAKSDNFYEVSYEGTRKRVP